MIAKKVIDIKVHPRFWQSKLIGVVLLLFALLVGSQYWWLGIVIGVPGLILLSEYAGTEIDVASNTFREYNSYLFIRVGEKEMYRNIESIIINRAKMAQVIYSARSTNSTTLRYVVYNAYLKVDDKKVFLTSMKNKTQLITKLRPAAAALGTELVDKTI